MVWVYLKSEVHTVVYVTETHVQGCDMTKYKEIDTDVLVEHVTGLWVGLAERGSTILQNIGTYCPYCHVQGV
jgi:hypothetical protein